MPVSLGTMWGPPMDRAPMFEGKIDKRSANRDLAAAERNTHSLALVVDDEPLMRWYLAEVLMASGYAVISADDCATTIRALTTATQPSCLHGHSALFRASCRPGCPDRFTAAGPGRC